MYLNSQARLRDQCPGDEIPFPMTLRRSKFIALNTAMEHSQRAHTELHDWAWWFVRRLNKSLRNQLDSYHKTSITVACISYFLSPFFSENYNDLLSFFSAIRSWQKKALFIIKLSFNANFSIHAIELWFSFSCNDFWFFERSFWNLWIVTCFNVF